MRPLGTSTTHWGQSNPLNGMGVRIFDTVSHKRKWVNRAYCNGRRNLDTFLDAWDKSSKQSKWKKKEEDTPKKFKTVPSASKFMLTIFWDYHGPVYCEFGYDVKVRVTQHTYFDNMLHLRAAIKNKRPGLLAKKPCLLHDDARPHTAQLVNLLESFHWKSSNTPHTRQT